MRLRVFTSTTLQLLLALLCGALLGVLDPQLAVSMKPLSDGFIRIIGWLMPVMMFLLIASGVAGLPSGQRGVAGRMVLYFQVMAVIALALAGLVAQLTQPGADTLTTPSAATLIIAPVADTGFSWASAGKVLVHALTQNPILQIMLAGLLTGLLLGRARHHRYSRPLHKALERAVDWLFQGLRGVLKFAPVAAFGAIAFTIGKFGPAAALPLIKFIVVMYLASAAFIVLVLAPIAQVCGLPLWSLVKHIKEQLLLVTFTGSSVAALPGLIEKMQTLGCDRQLTRLVLTTGYTFNLSGSNIYLIIAVLFLAQMAGIELTGAQLLTLLLISLVTSLGSTSMAGSAFFTLIATLNLLHIVPVDSVGLLLGVERLMKCRVLTNVLGNCVACLAITRWQRASERGALTARASS
ncbi:cation:dicarboxylase symporter family transporter [Pseudomonas sp. GD03842]|uniref:cation:dicarboxylate symporter family transporter n=1 Tax=Pseudomonas sp. GD03842 TaxID=2975385 RepID=UPI00244A0F9D|nr:cation:dicarboxylase symporter family transporter [Pseudomonas sp. GD03842]MDH0748434.1 cation:dicarboxylase symporter family transporter [Pseudomonas sp. GD03842]